jgi:S-adenosylmethionine decarboxylase proenzyme
MKELGFHIVAEFWKCSVENLKSAGKIINDVVKNSGFVKVGEAFHQFDPNGVTGIILLSTSHISIHTWPEINYASLDIYSCGGKVPAKKAFDICVKKFKPKKVIYKEFFRGFDSKVSRKIMKFK